MTERWHPAGLLDEHQTGPAMILSRPGEGYLFPVDLAKHNITTAPDAALAIEQHTNLANMLRDHGVAVHLIDPLPGHPNAVFTQDCAFVLPQGYIHLRMGLPSRRGEAGWMAAYLDSLDIPLVGTVTAPGTAEGGDLILAGKTVFAGLSSRTNKEGIRQLREIFARLGYEMRVAAVPSPSLHIGGMLSVIAPGRLLSCASRFDAALFRGFDVIPVPDASFISGNVITTASGRVIAEQRNTPSIDALQRAGVAVTALDLSEFVKGTGGPSCLVLPAGA